MTMFATHLGGNTDDDLPPEAGRVLDLLRTQRRPHLFMGDLNTYRVDQWNPSVPCTNPDSGGRTAVINQIEQAGYTDAWKATQSGEGWTGMANRPWMRRSGGQPLQADRLRLHAWRARPLDDTIRTRGARRRLAIRPRRADRRDRDSVIVIWN